MDNAEQNSIIRKTSTTNFAARNVREEKQYVSLKGRKSNKIEVVEQINL